MTLHRVPVLTAFALTSLAVGELPSDASPIALPNSESEADHLTVRSSVVEATVEEPVAVPETLPTTEFAPSSGAQPDPLPVTVQSAESLTAVTPVGIESLSSRSDTATAEVQQASPPAASITPPVQSISPAAPSEAAVAPEAGAEYVFESNPTKTESTPQAKRSSAPLAPVPNADQTRLHPPITTRSTVEAAPPSTPDAVPPTQSPSPQPTVAKREIQLPQFPGRASQPFVRSVASQPRPSRQPAAPANLAQTLRIRNAGSVAPPERVELPPIRASRQVASRQVTAPRPSQPISWQYASPSLQLEETSSVTPQRTTGSPPPLKQAQNLPVSTQASALGGPVDLPTNSPDLVSGSFQVPPVAAVAAPANVPATAATTEPSTNSAQSPEAQPLLIAGIAPPERIDSTESLLVAQQPPAGVASSLTDIQGNWAQDFIQYLAERNVVRGFPDRSFQPNAPITRAQFAAILQQAFETSVGIERPPTDFADISPTFWGYNAIQSAYRRGFLEKFADNTFRPDQPISRLQALAAVTQGLNLTPTNIQPDDLSNYFEDAAVIPVNDRTTVAASLENRLVVSYPNVRQLDPNQIASRADVSALIYQALVRLNQAPALPETSVSAQYIVSPQLATTPPEEPAPPTAEQIQDVQTRLQAVQETALFGDIFQGSPGITIANPSGFGADNNTAFISGSYQAETRGTNDDDGGFGVGVGFGDSVRAVGVEVSYTFASFGGSRDFGSGGFNLKVHRRLPQDFAVAIGYNGLINIGDENDFRDSPYGVVTKVFRTRDNIDQPFSRIAVSAGLGSGQFRSAEDIDDGEDGVNPFGSVAIRIARPVSFITEWTGQDLALGFSIAPFKNFNLVITPALRDVAGAGDEARFVLGIGTSFRF
jgi:hypothetical protein